MAKRRGVNSRKQYAQLRQRRAKTISKGLPMIALAVLVIAIAAGIVYSGRISYRKAAVALRNSTLFTVKNISIKGNDRIATTSILAQCGVATSMKIYDVNIEAVRTHLLQQPWIKKVHCVKKWWGSLIIEVTERKPIALCAAGEVALVAQDGTILPLEKSCTYDLPLLTGLRIATDRSGRRFVDSSSIARIGELIETVKMTDPGLFTVVTQLNVADPNVVRGFVKEPRTVVEIAYDADKTQISNLRYLLNALVERKEAPGRISIVYRNLAFVRKEIAENDVHTD